VRGAAAHAVLEQAPESQPSLPSVAQCRPRALPCQPVMLSAARFIAVIRHSSSTVKIPCGIDSNTSRA
jgi:hypothetical protein